MTYLTAIPVSIPYANSIYLNKHEQFMKKTICTLRFTGICIFILLAFQFTFVQTGTVKGVVKDVKRSLLPDAGVTGEQNFTATENLDIHSGIQ
jgi:hypothetical protein